MNHTNASVEGQTRARRPSQFLVSLLTRSALYSWRFGPHNAQASSPAWCFGALKLRLLTPGHQSKFLFWHQKLVLRFLPQTRNADSAGLSRRKFPDLNATSMWLDWIASSVIGILVQCKQEGLRKNPCVCNGIDAASQKRKHGFAKFDSFIVDTKSNPNFTAPGARSNEREEQQHHSHRVGRHQGLNNVVAAMREPFAPKI